MQIEKHEIWKKKLINCRRVVWVTITIKLMEIDNR